MSSSFSEKKGLWGLLSLAGSQTFLRAILICICLSFSFSRFSPSPRPAPLFAPTMQASWVWVTYIPNMNFIILDSPCACRHFTVVFALFFLTVPVSIHFCVVCRYFIRLYMSLFQRRSPVGNSTLMCSYW